MTFIGIQCHEDYAEVVTDTAVYTVPEPVKVRRNTKQFFLHHIDTVMTSSGNGRLGHMAQVNAESALINLDTFDDLIEAAPTWFAHAIRDTGLTNEQMLELGGTVYIVGPSQRAGRFACWALDVNNTRGEALPDLFVQPAPMSRGASLREVNRIADRTVEVFPEMAEEMEEVRRVWPTLRPIVVNSPHDWVAVAKRSRKERARMASAVRVFVAGDVMYTELRRGSSSSRIIHTFDDDGPEVDEMVLGSLHPRGQWLTCDYCESGRPFVECCAGDVLDDPCNCMSGYPFRECCLIPRGTPCPSFFTEPFGPRRC